MNQLRAPAARTEPPAPRPARPVDLGQAVVLSALLTIAWHLVMPLGRPLGDARIYLQLAADPAAPVRSPYNYRVLLPWLTHWLGGDPKRTYLLLTMGCLAATGPLVYLLCRRLGAAHWSGMAATAGLLCSRGWVFFLFDPWLSDPAAFLLLAACFLALVAGWLWLLAPLAMALSATRELAVGLVLPVYAFLARRRVDLFAAAVAVATVLAAAVAYRIIVATAPQGGGVGIVGGVNLGSVRYSYEHRVAHGNALPWLANTFGMSFGCWWVLAVAASGERAVRRLAWWLVPIVGAFLFGYDWSRFAMYAFPVVIPAAALALQRARHRTALLGLLGLQALVPLVDVADGQLTLNRPGPSLAFTVILMTVTALVLWWPRLPVRRG